MNYSEIENSLSESADLVYRMIARKNLKKAFLKGYAAASEGKPSTDCPYDHHKKVAGINIPSSYAAKWHQGHQYFES